MKLNYKITETEFIPFEFEKEEVKYNIEIKFDYPTMEQDYKLKEIINTIFLKFPDITKKAKDEKEVDKKETIVEYTAEQKAEADTMFLRYYEYYLKCTVKDIKGITDNKDEHIKVNIIDNELEYKLWSSVIRFLGTNNVISLFSLAQKELEINELDKKK